MTLLNRSITTLENDRLTDDVDLGIAVKTVTKLLGSSSVAPAIPQNESVVNEYDEASSVATGVETTVVTYTVPALTAARMVWAEASGTNIADFKVKVNGTTVARKWTWFASGLTAEFNFVAEANRGLILAAGDVVSITAVHARPSPGDFGARIEVIEIT